MTNIIASDIPRCSLQSIEPAIDPSNKPTFLLDWELTLKCNLDCSYCVSGPDGCHWNASSHPSLEECYNTIDFMFEYVDLYMTYKPKWSKAVVLNIYGGESLYHPDIVEILQQVHKKYKEHKYSWPLTVGCTTNLIVKESLLEKVEPLIEEWTVSYHCETTDKQKKLFLENVKTLSAKNKNLKIIILMHSNESYWPELLSLIQWCKDNNVNYLPRQLDGNLDSNYNKKQVKWFKDLYQSKTPTVGKSAQNKMLDNFETTEKPLSSVGRACCGGRKMCTDSDHKNNIFYVTDNNFYDWSCSVNWFFLYIRQFSKEIFVNKDCKMNFNGEIAPIGNLDYYKDLLSETKVNLESNNIPVIQCKKTKCRCGLCAPKALTRSKFDDIMVKHITQDVFRK